MPFKITVERHFDASHQLKSYDGKCQQLHGHTWRVQAVFLYEPGAPLPQGNMIVDFKVLKGMLDNFLPDHKHMNAFYMSDNPTAELVASVIFNQITADLLLQQRLRKLALLEITIFESDTCSVTFSGQSFKLPA